MDRGFGILGRTSKIQFSLLNPFSEPAWCALQDRRIQFLPILFLSPHGVLSRKGGLSFCPGKNA